MTAIMQNNTCFSQYYHKPSKHSQTVTLTTGTTTISDQSTANTNVIFAGTSMANEPTLQFIRPPNYTGDSFHSVNHSVRSLIVAGDPFPGGGLDYGLVSLGYMSNLTVTNGVLVSDGQLSFSQSPGSTLSFDGNILIDNGGTIYDQGGGSRGGSVMDINGTVTLGANGTNIFEPGVTEIHGSGTIVELNKLDVVSVGAVSNDFHINVRAGTFMAASPDENFNGTIGPGAGSNAPTLGDTAVVVLSLLNNEISEVQSAKFDTSIGLLALLDSNGGTVDTIHFTGNPQKLNFSIHDSHLVINNLSGIPGTIPTTFT